MSLPEFATATYSACVLTFEILFFAISFGRGVAAVLIPRIASAFRKRGMSLRSFVGSTFAALSTVRDFGYERFTPRRARQFDAIQEPSSPDRFVFWIHGTWRKAGFSGDQKLLSRLREAFPNARIVAFNWRARNLQHDRLAGIDALCSELEKTEYESVPIVLVGHSHGGSVAAAVAARLSERRVVRAVALATPFLSVDLNAADGRGSVRTRTSTFSALFLYQLRAVLVGLVVAFLIWSSGVHVLPPVVGLFTQGASDVFFALFAGAVVGLVLAYLRNMTLNRELPRVRQRIAELQLPAGYKGDMRVIRADDDPLLDTMDSTSVSHDGGVVGRVISDRKIESLIAGESGLVLDMVVKLALFVVGLLSIRPIFVGIAFFSAARLPSEDWVRAAVLGDAILILGVTALLCWRFPVKVLVALGGHTASLLLAVWPPNLLLAIAQARAAGLPIEALLVSGIRIADAPAGVSAIVVPSNGMLANVSVLGRHTEMLNLSPVIERVVKAIGDAGVSERP